MSTLVFYPFDLLKTRYMSQDGTVQRQHNGQTYNSIFRSLRTIRREEGFRAMFRGVPVAIVGSASAWGLYMFLYRALCNATEVTSYLGRSGASILASIISTTMCCPIFLIKSRMQLEDVATSSHYRSFYSGITHAVRTSGVRSLWRGASLQLLLVFPNALAIPTYDFLKSSLINYNWQRTHHAQSRDLNIAEVCLCSTLTKVLLLTISHPLMMMRVRLQDQRAREGPIQYRNVVQTVSTVLATRGVCGMYRGFSTALVHTLPRSLLQYVLYEKTLNYLCHRQTKRTAALAPPNSPVLDSTSSGKTT